jgi:hypothetical protein
MGPSSQCSHVPGTLTCHWLRFRSACLWPADDHAETKSQPQRRNVRLRLRKVRGPGSVVRGYALSKMRSKSLRHVDPPSSDASQRPAIRSGPTSAMNRWNMSGSSRVSFQFEPSNVMA